MEKLKQVLYQKCIDFVNKREETIQKLIASNKQALLSETKSSVGDKHETGRAMLQLELENISQQLEGITTMRNTLARVNIYKKPEIGCLGSIIITNKGNYFLSVSAGQIRFNEELYFAVSISSPIGKLFIGKCLGDVVQFRGDDIVLENIL